jgi:hypothetical protein
MKYHEKLFKKSIKKKVILVFLYLYIHIVYILLHKNKKKNLWCHLAEPLNSMTSVVTTMPNDVITLGGRTLNECFPSTQFKTSEPTLFELKMK